MELGQITKRWNILTVFAASICTCIGGFLVLPPMNSGSEEWVKFGVFAVALITGLWLVPVTIASERKVLRRWVWLAVILVATSICAFLAYNRIFDSWTFEYAGQRVVKGSILSTDAAATKREGESQGRVVSDRDLLWDRGGNISMVWPDVSERTHRTDQLLDFYLAQLLLFASAIVCVVQASYCAALPLVISPETNNEKSKV